MTLYHLYHSVLVGERHRFFVPGVHKLADAHYQLVFSGRFTPCGYPEHDTLGVLEELFMVHNLHDRPRRKEIRSLSMGDIIETGGLFYMLKEIDFIVLTEAEVVTLLANLVYEDPIRTRERYVMAAHVLQSPTYIPAADPELTNAIEQAVRDTLEALIRASTGEGESNV